MTVIKKTFHLGGKFCVYISDLKGMRRSGFNL